MSNFDPSNIDVEDFLDCLDIEFKNATEAEVLMRCPFPNHPGEDMNPSCYMNRETTAFFCHSCHEKGNAIHFAMKYLEITPMEAIRILKERYSPSGINLDARSAVEEVRKILEKPDEPVTENVRLPENLIDEFALDWERAYDAYSHGQGHPSTDYMFDRGFEWETLHEWGFGYDERSDRIVFPVRDDFGHLVGFKGRSWMPTHRPKYLVIGDSPGKMRYGFPRYQVSKVVFGLNEAISAIETASSNGDDSESELIVCEGELNVVMLWQMGYRNAVAINGSNFSERQERLIRSWADKVILFFDSLKRNDEGELIPDQAGQDATVTVSELLTPHLRVFAVPDHEGDPASMSPSEVDAMISGSSSFLVRNLVGS
jgi:DNA primase